MNLKQTPQYAPDECQASGENWRLLAKRAAVDVVVAVISTLIAMAIVAVLASLHV